MEKRKECKNTESSSSSSSPSSGSDEHHEQSGQKRDRRKYSKADKTEDKLEKTEKSRQSARECRVRKKMRYQYLDELVEQREAAIMQLRSELEAVKKHCKDIDEGRITKEAVKCATTDDGDE